MTIDGQTKLLGLLGWPVGHSLSPKLHNAAAALHQLNVVYLPLPVHPDNLEAAIRGAVTLGFRGLNVTIPHKQAVMAYLDEIDAAAQAIGAVNTIVIGEPLAVNDVYSPPPQNAKLETQNSKLFGTNTDWIGFLTDLAAWGFDPAGQDCLVLGAGGSARAVGYGLGQRGGRVHLWARRQEQAEQVASALAPHLPPGTITSIADLPAWLRHQTPTLIVNCTPLGMSPQVDISPWPTDLPFPPGVWVYDLVYKPVETKLLQAAAAGGGRTRNGLGMLIWQGLHAFQLWTGVAVNAEMVQKEIIY